MRRLFVCDFDGTIYNKNNIREFHRSLSELGRLKSSGDEFIIASGRPLHLLEPYFEDFEDTYFISNDGALFSRGFDIIAKRAIDKELVAKEYKGYNGGFIAYGRCISYARYSEAHTGRELDRFFRGHAERVGCICDIDEDIYKISFLSKHDVADFLKKCWSSYGIDEYVSKGTDKASALEVAIEFFKTDRNNTVVFGDGANDIEMMKMAGRSYAMASAPPRVKKEADKIIERVSDILKGEER